MIRFEWENVQVVVMNRLGDDCVLLIAVLYYSNSHNNSNSISFSNSNSN